MPRRKFIDDVCDDQLINLVKECISKKHLKEKLIQLNARYSDEFIDSFIKRLNLDTSHFSGRWKTDIQDSRYPLETRLVKGKFRGSSSLKKRLIKAKILDAKCSCCELTQWMGQPAPLELDHINGDPFDNTVGNLRILCPNCHAQTPTANGKNIKKKKYGGSSRTRTDN